MAPARSKSVKSEGEGPRRRKKKGEAEAASRGLTPAEVGDPDRPKRVEELCDAIARDGGAALRAYRDPLGGTWQVLAALPLDRVEPTPHQRDLSEAHAKRLTESIGRLERFLDPVLAVRTEAGRYQTPNGHHRAEAMRRLGARSIVALVVPEPEMAFQILALNTEKAHNVRERSIEVVRMARALASLDDRPERDFAVIFEEPAFLTLGLSYEARGRFAGGAYLPVLRRVEAFLPSKLSRALETRGERARRLLELDDVVAGLVASLRERGLESPYLKSYVIARVNPLHFQRKARMSFEELIEKMLGAGRRFDVSKVKPQQVARAAGPPEE